MLIEVNQFTDYFTREEFISIFVFGRNEESTNNMTPHERMRLAARLRYFAYQLSDVIMEPAGYWQSRAIYPKDYLESRDDWFSSLIEEHKESIALKITLLDESESEHIGFPLVDCVADFVKVELLIDKPLARAIATYLLIIMVENNDI